MILITIVIEWTPDFSSCEGPQKRDEKTRGAKNREDFYYSFTTKGKKIMDKILGEPKSRVAKNRESTVLSSYRSYISCDLGSLFVVSHCLPLLAIR